MNGYKLCEMVRQQMAPDTDIQLDRLGTLSSREWLRPAQDTIVERILSDCEE